MKKRNRNILIGLGVLILLILMPWGPNNSSTDVSNATENSTKAVSNDSEPANKTVEKSSDNPKEPQIPNKYNKLIQNVSGDLIWETDTCPLCGAKDAEAQSETNNLIKNVCWKCGYEFYQQTLTY